MQRNTVGERLLGLPREAARLPGYHYEHHVGGVLYLYLRGVDQAGYGVHTERLPFALIDAMDQLFAQEAVTHVA